MPMEDRVDESAGLLEDVLLTTKEVVGHPHVGYLFVSSRLQYIADSQDFCRQ